MPSPALKRKDIALCYPAEPGRVSRLAADGDGIIITQPKLNGHRCWVDWFQGNPVLLSSYGKVHQGLTHIEEALYSLPKRHYDGELYVHGWPRERLHSAVSRKKNHTNPDTEGVQFHIFDYKSKSQQRNRTLTLLQDFAGQALPFCIQLVPTYVIPVEDWQNKATYFVHNGFEGIILRSFTAPYEAKRTVKWLKFKPTEEDVYQILGVEEAISIDGIPKNTLGSFIVAGDDGTPFNVGAGKLTHVQREELWQTKNSLLSKRLLVKHEAITTTNGVPLCAVAVEVLY